MTVQNYGTQLNSNEGGRTVGVDAVELTQAGHRIFVTALTAEQLIESTMVDYYDSSKAASDPTQGYQRPAERSRITRIGSYLAKNSGQNLFPTALLLGARTPLGYDPVTRRLQLPLDNALRLIDGQHRREGLRYVIEDRGHDIFRTMQIPVVIMESSSKIEEMTQFKTINGNAKPVRTDLVNAILTAIEEDQGITALDEKDHWKVVVMKVVMRLDQLENSPWHGLLLMPDELGMKSAPGKITRATSMITSIRPLYEWLKQLQFLEGKSIQESSEYMADVLVGYWSAIRSLVPEAFEKPEDYVIQKTPGLFALHWLLKEELLPNMWHGHRWGGPGQPAGDEDVFIEFLRESPEICDEHFWQRSAGRASAYGSMKGFRDLAEALKDSVRPSLGMTESRW